MKMAEDTVHHRCFIIDFIVIEYYSAIQAVLKHPLIGAWGHVMKSSNGNIHEEIPVPYFLTDTSYRMKVFSKQIFSIVNGGKAHRCGCTKENYLQLKNDWGCTIKNNRNKSLYELWQASKVTLEHMFNNHDTCSVEWCFMTR